MGGTKSKHPLDKGSDLDTTYTELIPFRNTLTTSYRIEPPQWVESANYSLSKCIHVKHKREMVLHKQRITDKATKELHNMLTIHGRLVHPNIRQLDAVFQTNSHYYMTYAYFPGCAFTQYMIDTKKTLSANQVRALVRDLLEALQFIHNSGVILRNFDPSNILYDGKSTLIIGLSKARIYKPSKRKSKHGPRYAENFTSVLYRAPEVIKQDYDQRADIWVVGVMLHFLLTGSLPFVSNNVDELYDKICSADVNRDFLASKGVDPLAVQLLIGMLEKDPDVRISVQSALTSEWLKIKGDALSDQQSVQLIKNARLCMPTIAMADVLANFIARRSFIDDEVENLKKLFRKMDANGDGVLTKDEMLFATEKLGMLMSADDIDTIFEKYDVNKTQQLEFNEFVAAFMDNRLLTDRKKLEEFFDFVDADQTGWVEMNELKESLGFNMTSIEDKNLYAKYSGKDRRLSKDEFVEFILDMLSNGNKAPQKVNRNNSMAQPYVNKSRNNSSAQPYVDQSRKISR